MGPASEMNRRRGNGKSRDGQLGGEADLVSDEADHVTDGDEVFGDLVGDLDFVAEGRACQVHLGARELGGRIQAASRGVLGQAPYWLLIALRFGGTAGTVEPKLSQQPTSSQRPGFIWCSKVPQTQFGFCRLLTWRETRA